MQYTNPPEPRTIRRRRSSGVVGVTMTIVDAVRAAGLVVRGRLLERQVDRQQPVHPGGRGVADGVLEAVGDQRVQVAEEHQRDLRAFADAADQVQHPGEGGAAGQGALGGALVGRAVGQRIGEGNAQLDDVRPRLFQAQHGVEGGVQRRVAGGDVRDEPLAPRFAQVAEAGVDAVGFHGKSVRLRR
ncbi:MAG: hypothetical protein U1G05_11285 [Kiritimatiellia bacterium]